MVKIAKAFTEEAMIEDQEDALDAVCEFINCVNGFLAIEYSLIPAEIDMEPPVYYAEEKIIRAEKEMFVLPMMICGEEVEYIIAVDTEVTVE